MSALPSVLDMPCPWCHAQPGQQCTRHPSGNIAQQPHRRRWANRKTALAQEDEFIVTILHDDPRLGLSAGEQYTAIRYWLDPGSKVMLLRRTTDGWQPECTVYHHHAEFVGWAK